MNDNTLIEQIETLETQLKVLKAGIEELQTELEGVMWFVDIWLEKDDLNQQPIVRAAIACKIALQAIEQTKEKERSHDR